MATHNYGQTQILDAPGTWQASYNQMMGIPSTGRSIYQNWLANQYGRAATAYSYGQVSDPGYTPATAEIPAVAATEGYWVEDPALGRIWIEATPGTPAVAAAPAQWAGGSTFRDWLGKGAAVAPVDATSTTAAVPGKPQYEGPWRTLPGQAETFSGLTGQQQRTLMGRMPTGGGFNPEETMFRSRLEGSGVPNWLGRNLTSQAFAGYPQWAIDPDQGLQTGEGAPSFLGYLYDRYGLGGQAQTAPPGGPISFRYPWS